MLRRWHLSDMLRWHLSDMLRWHLSDMLRWHLADMLRWHLADMLRRWHLAACVFFHLFVLHTQAPRKLHEDMILTNAACCAGFQETSVPHRPSEALSSQPQERDGVHGLAGQRCCALNATSNKWLLLMQQFVNANLGHTQCSCCLNSKPPSQALPAHSFTHSPSYSHTLSPTLSLTRCV